MANSKTRDNRTTDNGTEPTGTNAPPEKRQLPELPGPRFRTTAASIATVIGAQHGPFALKGWDGATTKASPIEKLDKNKIADAVQRFCGRVIVGTASTAAVDFHNERVLPEGAKASIPAFLKNPLLGANHRYAVDGRPTILGSVVDVAADGEGVYFVAGFDDDELSLLWWNKVAKGIIKGISIGFLPEQWDWEPYTDDAGKERRRLVHTVWRLLEISVAPLQANPEAMAEPIRGLELRTDPGLDERIRAAVEAATTPLRAAIEELVAARDTYTWEGEEISFEERETDAPERVFTLDGVARAANVLLEE